MPILFLFIKSTPVPSALSMAMDVDIAWKIWQLSLKGCHYCGDTNYLVRDFPHYLDIRQLMIEQWKELIEDLLALKDSVSKEENSPVEEDFV